MQNSQYDPFKRKKFEYHYTQPQFNSQKRERTPHPSQLRNSLRSIPETLQSPHLRLVSARPTNQLASGSIQVAASAHVTANSSSNRNRIQAHSELSANWGNCDVAARSQLEMGASKPPWSPLSLVTYTPALPFPSLPLAPQCSSMPRERLDA